ncbi:uncharacterized protein LOC125891993 isoform X2 [Epinephelus fuscoguttatus]|uniref:uncharacterized protein LOC125891993 isoform X2 n=1 Tax=Epinephelus fuscoguttatus TaxID=293821 RepID=UPI0020D0E287|nr:uncharacterized protein LOC125891993 isoform X2 [Epinephelus fuscoguttatus]
MEQDHIDATVIDFMDDDALAGYIPTYGDRIAARRFCLENKELPKHMLLLDVRTRWNSLYLMMERFCEQFPAIQAAAIDPRIRKPMEKERLAKIGNEDLRKAEAFVLLMRKHYTSTLAVSSDKSPTCGEILPILQKLEQHYTVQEGDSAFTRSIKENIWNDLSKRYQAGTLFLLNEIRAVNNSG